MRSLVWAWAVFLGEGAVLFFPSPGGALAHQDGGLLVGLGPLTPASSVLWARPSRSADLSGMLPSLSGLGGGDPSVLGPRECRAHGRG